MSQKRAFLGIFASSYRGNETISEILRENAVSIVLKIEKNYFTFLFLSVLLSIQRTVYSLQHTVKKKRKRKEKMFKGEKC